MAGISSAARTTCAARTHAAITEAAAALRQVAAGEIAPVDLDQRAQKSKPQDRVGQRREHDPVTAPSTPPYSAPGMTSARRSSSDTAMMVT